MNYRVIQLTNNNIPAVAANENLPLGGITRSIRPKNGCCQTMTASTSQSDTITLNENGNYNIAYTGSLVAAAAGVVNVSLVINGTTLYTASASAAAAGDVVNLAFMYQHKVCPCCGVTQVSCPASINIVLGDIAITGGTENILVERVYT